MTQLLNSLVTQIPPAAPLTPCSSEAYDRLLAGETVSWLQILREHRMLGAITVPQLIELGAIRVAPVGPSQSQVTDVRLSLQDQSRHRQMRTRSGRSTLKDG